MLMIYGLEIVRYAQLGTFQGVFVAIVKKPGIPRFTEMFI